MRQVCDVMTRGVRTMCPTDSLMAAAQAMDELDIGAVPVCDGDKLIGMVTDRDIAVRGVAQGLPVDKTELTEVMSQSVYWCYEDEPVDDALDQMRQAQIRRLPVVDRDKHVVGMLSLGDVAVKDSNSNVSRALEEISEPAEPDRSGLSQASGAAGGGSASGKASGTPG